MKRDVRMFDSNREVAALVMALAVAGSWRGDGYHGGSSNGGGPARIGPRGRARIIARFSADRFPYSSAPRKVIAQIIGVQRRPRLRISASRTGRRYFSHLAIAT